LFFREIYRTRVFAAVKDKFEKIKKTAFTNPTFCVFKFRIPLEAMCCKKFGRFQRRKFKKITYKAVKTVKNTFAWAFMIQD